MPSKAKPKVDPEILKLRKKHQLEVKQYIDSRKSAALLKTMIDKRIPSLTNKDREKLLDHLMTVATPKLPMDQGVDSSLMKAQAAEDGTLHESPSPWPTEGLMPEET